MRIDIISVIPELIESPFNASILKRAIDKKLIEIKFHDIKDYASNKRRQVDDYQFGGGSGMVMMIEPIKKMY
jgi:tRNA (guanine37-N1)-methyltransferase